MTASKTTTLRPLSAQSSKQEEIDFLATVRALAGEQSYVGDLLTADLMTWFESQVRSDFSTNLYDWMQSEAEAARYIDAEVGKLQTLVAEQRELHKRQMQQVQDELDRERARVDEYAQREEARREQVNRLMDEITEQQETIERMEAEAEALRAKIVSLKAALYDMEHPEA